MMWLIFFAVEMVLLILLLEIWCVLYYGGLVFVTNIYYFKLMTLCNCKRIYIYIFFSFMFILSHWESDLVKWCFITFMWTVLLLICDHFFFSCYLLTWRKNYNSVISYALLSICALMMHINFEGQKFWCFWNVSKMKILETCSETPLRCFCNV